MSLEISLQKYSLRRPTFKKSSFKPVFDEERRFPGEEDDDVEQVFPVRADGVAGNVGREVDVGPGDDVQKLAVVP